MNKKHRLPAMESRDFRLWFVGQGVSVIGTWLQNTGQAWLVLKITNSPTKLGLLTAVQYIPTLVLALFIGPFVDTYPKRTILLWTQSLFAIAAAALAAVSFMGNEQYWVIMLISLLTGIVTAVDWPARQAFVSEQVLDKAAVTNAVRHGGAREIARGEGHLAHRVHDRARIERRDVDMLHRHSQ